MDERKRKMIHSLGFWMLYFYLYIQLLSHRDLMENKQEIFEQLYCQIVEED